MSRGKRRANRMAQGGMPKEARPPAVTAAERARKILGQDHVEDELANFTTTTKAMQDAFARASIRITTPPMTWAPSAAPHARPEFSGSEFVAGTAVGIRSWDVDKLGRLLSPSFRMVWPPTEVLAECRKAEDMLTVTWTLGGDRTVRPTERRSEVADDHLQASCSCGFYAYYEGFNDYSGSGRVTGVIEGYGETQIGSRGFKSAKARIVALYLPEVVVDEDRVGPSRTERVRHNYGEHVAIFDDYAHMVAEYPTTAPEQAPTPDTDPDFWTRSES